MRSQCSASIPARTAASPALRQFVAAAAADSTATWAEEEPVPWAAVAVSTAAVAVDPTAVEVAASTAAVAVADRMAAVGANPPAMHY